ncbi:MAG TPA: molybdenum ABC transporter ATP-binding protein [Usitatibacteraceae bacterium]
MLEVDVEQRLGEFELRATFASEAPVVALFGRSGSGKSSLINLLAGIARAGRGRIVFNNEVLLDTAAGIEVPPEARRIGYVFQDGMLFPHLNVRHNLEYGEKRVATSDRYIDRDKVITLLGLEELLERKPVNLSGGEKQRVAIGRALLASPRLLLLDEPLASLDSIRKSEILQYIELLRDEFRIPIVFVSHAVEEVTRLADEIVLLDRGRVTATGSVEAIMGRLDLKPLTGRYEAGAVIEAMVASHDMANDLVSLSFNGGSFVVPGVGALVGERVRLRVRARDVSIATSQPRGISILNTLPGRVIEISDETGPIVDVRIRIGEAVLIARITRYSARQLSLAVGLPVYALVKAISLDRHSVGFA